MALDLRAGPCAMVRHSVLPEDNRQCLSRVPQSFRLARLTVVSRRETYFPRPSPTDTGLALCRAHV